jgi:hypothetical protein
MTPYKSKRKILYENGLGRGSIVRLKKTFGSKEVPVGTKGKVFGYYDPKKPVVIFDGFSDSPFAPEISMLDVVKRVSPDKGEMVIVSPSGRVVPVTDC